MLDLNPGAELGGAYGGAVKPMAVKINTLIDEALMAKERPRAGVKAAAREADGPGGRSVGGARIGEPCLRRLAYEVLRVSVDPGRETKASNLRVMKVGHVVENLAAGWLIDAGFELLTRGPDGEQLGFVALDGRVRGRVDGMIVDGPDVGLEWPALWEHKALGPKSWCAVVKRGVRDAHPIYYAQMQIYMAELGLERGLFSASNRDTLELYHEAVPIEPAVVAVLGERVVQLLLDLRAETLPPRIADTPTHYLCQWCPYSWRCWDDGVSADGRWVPAGTGGAVAALVPA